MATKANLISTVNGFFTALISQLKLRSGAAAVIDELYPVKVSDSQTTETLTTKNADFNYSITIVKQGRSIRINGSYTSLRGFILPSGTKVFELKNNEFKGDTSFYLDINCAHAPASQINTITPTAAGETKQFSVTYNSNS